MTNDECRKINDECWMMTAVTSKKTRLNRSPNSELGAATSKKTRLNHIGKKQDWAVFHLNSDLGAVTSKKTRLSRFPFEQWPRCSYSEENKTEPFPIWTVTLALLHRKKQDWAVSHLNSDLGAVTSKRTRPRRFPFEQWPWRCYIEKNKTERFPIWTVTLALLYRKKQDWAVSHLNSDLCAVTSEKTIFIEKDKTEPFFIWTVTLALLHRKKQDRAVSHLNSDLALLHRKKQDWAVSHLNTDLGSVTSEQTRLSRFPFEQWPWRCYIKKNKTEPFPIALENSALLYWKRQDRTVSHLNSDLAAVTSEKTRLSRFPSEQLPWLRYIEKNKTEPFPIAAINCVLLPWKSQDWTVPHINKELSIVTLQKIRLGRSPS